MTSKNERVSRLYVANDDLLEWGRVCTIEKCHPETRARLARMAAQAVSSQIYRYDFGLSAEYREREAAWCRAEEYMIADIPDSGESEAKSYKEIMLQAPDPVAYLHWIFRTVAKTIVADEGTGVRNKDGSLSKRFVEFSGDVEIFEGVTFFDILAGEGGQTGIAEDREREIPSIFIEPATDGDAIAGARADELKALEIWEESDTNDRYLLLLLANGLSRLDIANCGLLTIKQSSVYGRFDKIKAKIMGDKAERPRAAAYQARSLMLHLQSLAEEWMETLENRAEIRLVLKRH